MSTYLIGYSITRVIATFLYVREESGLKGFAIQVLKNSTYAWFERMVYKWQIIEFELPIAEGNKGTFGRIFSFPNTETQKVGRIKSVWEQTSNFI